MPKPHPFAAASASKGRARAVPKPALTIYGYAHVSTGGQSVDARRLFIIIFSWRMSVGTAA
jgi:hypothetical protein